MNHALKTTFFIIGFWLVHLNSTAAPLTGLIPETAQDILQQPAFHSWMIEAIELKTESVIGDINEHLGNEAYNLPHLVLGNCLRPIGAKQEFWCQNIFSGLAGVSNAQIDRIIQWHLNSPDLPHAQYIFALSLHNRALLHQAASTQLGNTKNDQRLYQLFENAALMELDQILDRTPDHPYAVALKFNILSANPDANRLAIEQLINHAMAALQDSWLVPSSALLALSNMESKSFLPLEKFVYFWQQKNESNEVNDLLSAEVKLIKAKSHFLGHPDKPSKKLADQLIFEAFATGLRTPKMLVLMSDRPAGKAISNHQRAWKYAAYLSAPESVENLLNLSAEKSLGSSEESYWYSAQLARLNTDHLLPNVMAASKALANKNELAAIPLFNTAFQQSMISAELWPMAKKLDKQALYTDILITKYLLHSFNLESIYMEFTLDYLTKSRYLSRKGISMAELFMVYPLNRYVTDVEDAINDSPMTRDQMIQLAKIENGERQVIRFPERAKLALTPELNQQLIAASNSLKTSLLANLKSEFDQYVTEMDGLCLADCKWKTSE